MQDLTRTITPKQSAFIHDKSRETLFSGAIRAGKTVALLAKAVECASIRGARVGLCRKTLTAFRRTTLKALIEGDGNTPPILPPGSYDHNETKGEIKLKYGGSIVYFSLEEPDRVRGLTLSACGVDEATDLDEEDWLLLLGRVNVKLSSQPLQLFGACNPRAPSHWLAKRFGITGKSVDRSVAVQGCSARLTSAFENPFLAPEYLDLLRTYSGVAYERDVMGWWVSAEGLVYRNFDRRKHCQRIQDEEYQRIIVAVDDGYNDPFVALLLGLTDDNRLHVLREVYLSGLSTDAKIEKVRSLIGDYEVERAVVDDAAATLIDDLRQANLPAIKAGKGKIHGGIAKVYSRLERDDAIAIHPDCRNLLAELEQYEYEAGTERPKSGSDHAADALRYGVLYLDKGATSPVLSRRIEESPVTPTKEEARVETEKRAQTEFERLWNDRTFSRIA